MHAGGTGVEEGAPPSLPLILELTSVCTHRASTRFSYTPAFRCVSTPDRQSGGQSSIPGRPLALSPSHAIQLLLQVGAGTSVAGPGWPHLPYGLRIGSECTYSNYSISAPRTPHMIRDNWVDVTNVPPKESDEGIWGCATASDSDSVLVTSTLKGPVPSRMVEVSERSKACRVSLSARKLISDHHSLDFILPDVQPAAPSLSASLTAPPALNRAPHPIGDDRVDMADVPREESGRGVLERRDAQRP
ncbi:unnamed protein product [Darwinula stevensoni]|uniref:Uncharacterized protein n=1 Tax=Darwinula stevensoni TaxID=69355 RepID=A0A7R9AFT3_9CRUS|nr:unnamed protein product [Darwinula stevensoni]CAG0903319.1 unnamed protein product [Darwinula stevensoni]